MLNFVLKKAKDLFYFFLVKNIGYRADVNYKINIVEGRGELIKAEDNFKPLLTIVSRSNFNEEFKPYPVKDKKELINMFELDPASSLFCIWNYESEDLSYASSWHFNKDFINNLDYLTLLIPETLLIALTLDKNKVATCNFKQRYFVARLNQGFYSSSQTTIIKDVNAFIMAAGVTSSSGVEQIDKLNIGERFLTGLKKVKLSVFMRSLFTPSNFNHRIFKGYIYPAILIIFLYLIMSFSYLSYKSWEINEKLNTFTGDVEAALNLESQLSHQIKLNSDLFDVVNDFQVDIFLFKLFLTLSEQVEFSNIRIENGRYILRGEAPKATDVLAFISQQSHVFEAKFDFPVQKSRNLEFFVISFIVDEEENP